MASIQRLTGTLPTPFNDSNGGTSNIINMMIRVFATMHAQSPTKASELLESITVNNSNFDGSSGSGGEVGYSVFELFLIIFAGSVLSVLTFGMNFMVMVSFKMDKQLQTISNFFLFSLAVADFSIGLVSIPLMTYYTAKGSWGLGYPMCVFWLCWDYLMSNASVLNLLLISFDRYFSVTRPLTYRPRRTTSKALLMIASTYILSLMLWPPWIISWPYLTSFSPNVNSECIVRFIEINPAVTIATICAAFYLPVSIMIALYARVFYETKKRQREVKKLQEFHQRSQYCKRTPVIDANHSHPATATPTIPRKLAKLTGVDEYAVPNSQGFRAEIKQKGAMGWIRRVVVSNAAQFFTVSDEEISSNADELDSLVDYSSSKGVSMQTESTTVNNRTAAVSTNSRTPARKKTVSVGRSNGEQVPMLPRRTISAHGAPAKLARSAPSEEDTYTVLINIDNADPSQRKKVKMSTECSEEGGGSSILVIENASVAEADSSLDNHELPKPPDSSTFVKDRSQSEALILHGDEGIHRIGESSNHPQKAYTPTFTGYPKPAAKKPQLRVKTHSKQNIEQKRKEKTQKRAEKKQDSKAAKTLSAILLAFILTWLPYSVIILFYVYDRNSVSVVWWNISYFLCYINSTINPFCYALCNQNFREAYKRMLTCQWKKPRRGAQAGGFLTR